jgi:hypothetical protein
MLRCVGFLVARMSEGKRSACIGTPHTSCGMAMALWESVGCGMVTAMAFLAYTVLGAMNASSLLLVFAVEGALVGDA